MQADLLFNIGDLYAPPIYQAIVALDQAYETCWPLDVINEALAISYGNNMALPWIYVVTDDGGTIGYLVMPRNDRLTDDELYAAFWGMLEEQGLADADQHRYNQDTPFSCQGDWDETAVGIVAYPTPYGAKFPAEPVNTAIKLLMGQSDWPSSNSLWLYPVRKSDIPLMRGLLISGKMDNLNETPQLDDVMFTRIRDLNHAPNISALYPTFQRKRFYIQ